MNLNLKWAGKNLWNLYELVVYSYELVAPRIFENLCSLKISGNNFHCMLIRCAIYDIKWWWKMLLCAYDRNIFINKKKKRKKRNHHICIAIDGKRTIRWASNRNIFRCKWVYSVPFLYMQPLLETGGNWILFMAWADNHISLSLSLCVCLAFFISFVLPVLLFFFALSTNLQ